MNVKMMVCSDFHCFVAEVINQRGILLEIEKKWENHTHVASSNGSEIEEKQLLILELN